MKKLFFAMIFAALAFTSCVDETPEMQAVDNVTITLSYSGADFDATTPSVGKVVKLKSALREYSAVTNAQGVATFSGVIPDAYNVSSSGVLNDDERQHLVDPPAPGIKVMTNGSIGGLEIYANVETDMNMKVGVESNIIISKIFYNGSKDNDNKPYSLDYYVEFYNNSDETVTTENLYFALLDTDSGDPFLDQKEENVYGKDVYKFPLMTLAPGASIVFACEARDHTLQAANSVDLTNADLQTERNAGPNAIIMKDDKSVHRTFTGIPFLSFMRAGGDAVILFKTTDNPADFAKVPPLFTKPSTNLHLKIPTNSILDGIDTRPYKNPINTATKRLSNKIDATYVVVPTEYSGSNNGVSFDRKVIGITETGRRVLKDTNNSVEDFVPLHFKAAPRDYNKPELYIDNPELLQ